MYMYLIGRLWRMEARYETHRLIGEMQRDKKLEAQAKQVQVVPVAVPAEEVTVPRIPTPPPYNLDEAERNWAHVDIAEYVASCKVQTQP